MFDQAVVHVQAFTTILILLTSRGRCPADTALPRLETVVGVVPDQKPHSGKAPRVVVETVKLRIHYFDISRKF